MALALARAFFAAERRRKDFIAELVKLGWSKGGAAKLWRGRVSGAKS